MKKMLVVYYSWSNGNTKRIAEQLAAATNADIARIDTAQPYSGSHEEVVEQGQREVEAGFMPQIKPLSVSIADYDVIAIGTPTWWYTMAPAVLTFLHQQDFTGKTVIPFMTNGGWPGHVIKDMEAECKGAKFAHEMKIQFDSTGGDRLETPERVITKWVADVKKDLSKDKRDENMQIRTLGKDLKVSAVGLGCMGMSHAYGAPADKKEMTELLAEAVDMGYTFFDTAEVYGTPENPHDNEELVGAALKPYRGKIVLATKFGIHFDQSSPEVNKPLVPDSRPYTIRTSVEASLQRLQTDHIDLYYQHRNDPKVPIEEVAGVMSELIQEGKITHWGLSEATEEQIRRAHAVCPVTAVQNRYSMMARWYETLFPVLEELQIGYVAFSPLANGFLTAKYGKDYAFDGVNDYRSVMPQFSSDGIDKNHDLLELLYRTAHEKNATPAQISMAWMLCKKPYIVPIPGTRKYDRLKENAGAAEIHLTKEEVTALDEALGSMEMSEVFGGSRVKP